MTKKDYIIIARVINDSVEGQKEGSHRIVSNPRTIIGNIAYSLSEELQKDNNKFNPEKFLTACGIIITK